VQRKCIEIQKHILRKVIFAKIEENYGGKLRIQELSGEEHTKFANKKRAVDEYIETWIDRCPWQATDINSEYIKTVDQERMRICKGVQDEFDWKDLVVKINTVITMANQAKADVDNANQSNRDDRLNAENAVLVENYWGSGFKGIADFSDKLRGFPTKFPEFFEARRFAQSSVEDSPHHPTIQKQMRAQNGQKTVKTGQWCTVTERGADFLLDFGTGKDGEHYGTRRIPKEAFDEKVFPRVHQSFLEMLEETKIVSSWSNYELKKCTCGH